jgi:hypothetical protein
VKLMDLYDGDEVVGVAIMSAEPEIEGTNGVGEGEVPPPPEASAGDNPNPSTNGTS